MQSLHHPFVRFIEYHRVQQFRLLGTVSSSLDLTVGCWDSLDELRTLGGTISDYGRLHISLLFVDSHGVPEHVA